ncbi:MAG: hypothetical protein HS117_03425 [Verrucomicrobiaceae bacterium]|nr:hypothetical protein [Verrucomicrobiaceae bacterium]
MYPSSGSFDGDANSKWWTYLGEVVKPLSERFPDLLFWTTDYGDRVRLRVFSQEEEVHAFVQNKVECLGMWFPPNPDDNEIEVTLLSDLGSDRFLDWTIACDADDLQIRRQQRAMLTLRFLCATVRLYLDDVIKKEDGKWEWRKTPHQENPCGNNFESLIHLVGNITRFEFDLIGTLGTAWRLDGPQALARCRLW